MLIQIAEQLRELTQPHDLYGRFGGQVFTLFLERGALRDVEAWHRTPSPASPPASSRAPQHVVGHLHDRPCRGGPTTERLDALLVQARRSNQIGRDKGGNASCPRRRTRARASSASTDRVQQIKTALMENRFRLAHLPMASLGGEQLAMFDTVLRMIDAQGDEVAAAEFMPAAFRNRLMRAIDRWVIGATLGICAKTKLDSSSSSCPRNR